MPETMRTRKEDDVMTVDKQDLDNFIKRAVRDLVGSDAT